mgnify:CR=1 FL=1
MRLTCQASFSWFSIYTGQTEIISRIISALFAIYTEIKRLRSSTLGYLLLVKTSSEKHIEKASEFPFTQFPEKLSWSSTLQKNT